MFTGRTIVLTGVGADGQVGEVVARAFAGHGAALVIVDRRAEQAVARAASLSGDGHSARGYGCDLADAAAVEGLAQTVRDAHGGSIHGLVHLAGGFSMSGPVADSAVDVWNRMFSINLTTAYHTSRALLPLLRVGGGAIVFFASQAVLPGATGAKMSAYAAAKSGVVALMRAIAAEETSHGIRANAVAPGSIRTAANVRDMGPDAKYVEREDVAEVVLFLCSDAAAAVTGQILALTPSERRAPRAGS
jgi:NAD(P)-dependent dehydrogenase (short-subunit alcohol dehydrogenase family)